MHQKDRKCKIFGPLNEENIHLTELNTKGENPWQYTKLSVNISKDSIQYEVRTPWTTDLICVLPQQYWIPNLIPIKS